MAREIKKRMHRDGGVPAAHELYSGMPPLEVFKALISIFANKVHESQTSGEEWIHKFYDISRAHFYKEAAGRELDPDAPDREGDKDDMVGPLLETMYVTVYASHSWQEDCGQHLKEKKKKFEQGASNPALFFHEDKGIAGDVHGDDPGFVVPEKWFDEVLGKYDFKVMGKLASVSKEKQIEWYEQYMEPDARYVEQLTKELEIESDAIGPASGPAVKRSKTEIIESERSSPVLDVDHQTKYRSLVMRVKEEPKQSRWEFPKRIGRYLKWTQFVEIVSIIQAIGCRLDGAALKGEGGAPAAHGGDSGAHAAHGEKTILVPGKVNVSDQNSLPCRLM